ncbi:MAG TPA: sugar ABC transporter ATP-binding protein [Labilithrix sp.]
MTLAIDGVRKRFGANEVLRGVTFDVARGHVHALLGENGAGKSTLVRILVGLEKADAGTVRASGAPYIPGDVGPASARRAGIVMVPQERTLCAHLTVLENVVLGVEPAKLGVVRAREARELAAEAVSTVVGDATRVPLDARAGELSVADQQLVEIARALASGKGKLSVLILDEPTASLGKDDAVRLFERVRSLKESGIAIVLVTHYLADVREHADRYTVLRDGKVAGGGDPKTTEPQQIVHEMLGRELEEAREAKRAIEADGDVVLEVRDLAGEKKPERASFALRRGEILGIAGLVGSGRTELLRAIAGLDRRRRGDVHVRAPRGLGLLSEDRGGEGLMLGRSIAENVTLTRGGPVFVAPSATLAEGAKWIAELAIRASGPDQRTGDLSGGNQQKVQIARLLREDYDVLLVDEPTRGIDVASKAQVLGLLRDLAKRGKAIVLVSSQLDELVSTCDRIAVLERGVLRDATPVSEWTEEKLLLEAAS